MRTKRVGIEDLFEIAHRAVLEEGAVVGVDLDVVVGGFEVVDVFDGDDLDLSGGFDDDALLLGGGFGGGVEEGLLRGGGAATVGSGASAGVAPADAYAAN